MVDSCEGLGGDRGRASHIVHLRDASKDVLLMTAADKLHDARAVLTDLMIAGPDRFTRFNGEPDQILAYYRSILGVVLESRGIAPVLDMPLRHAVEQIAILMPTPLPRLCRLALLPITPRKGAGSPRLASSCSSWPTRPASR